MKFNTLKDMVGKGIEGSGGIDIPTGGDDFLSRIHSTIIAFRDVLKIAQELRGVKGDVTPDVIDRLPDYPPNPKKLPVGSNPALAKFLAQYGDTTINETLKIIGPMTIKQLIAMVQHGTRPGK